MAYTISELPAFIQEIVKIRGDQNTDSRFNHNSLDLLFAFNWNETPEGGLLWTQVFNSEYQLFYEFHVDKYKEFKRIRPNLFNKPLITKSEVFPRAILVKYYSDWRVRIAVCRIGEHMMCMSGSDTLEINQITSGQVIILHSTFKELDE